MGTCDFEGIFIPDVVVVCVVWRYYEMEASKLGHDAKDAHGLGPAMTIGPFCGQGQFVAEPLVEDVVEEHHGGIHVESTLVIGQFMTHYISHGGPLGESGDVLHIVQILQKVIRQGEVLLSDVVLLPKFKLEVRVEFHVGLDYFLFEGRDLPANPDVVNDLRNQWRFVADSVRFVFHSRVEDCKFVHGDAILHKVVHVDRHTKWLEFEIIPLEFALADFFIVLDVDDQLWVIDNLVGHVENMLV